jgi:hypothetical protein
MMELTMVLTIVFDDTSTIDLSRGAALPACLTAHIVMICSLLIALRAKRLLLGEEYRAWVLYP